MSWKGVIAVLVVAVCLLFLTLLCVQPAKAQTQSVLLTWTATGNDTTWGTASNYEVAHSQVVPDTTGVTAWLDGGGSFSKAPLAVQNWYNAISTIKVTDPAAPKVAGSPESWTLAGFAPNTTEWFLLRVCDPVSNCARSNFAQKFFPIVDIWPPRPIRNLKAN